MTSINRAVAIHEDCIRTHGSHTPADDHDSCANCGLSGEVILVLVGRQKAEAFEVRFPAIRGYLVDSKAFDTIEPKTIAGRFEQVADLLAPRDGSTPMLNPEQALKLLDAPAPFYGLNRGIDVPHLPVRVDPWMPEGTVALVSPRSVKMLRLATDVTALARAIFETDADLVAFASERSESCGWDGTGTWEAFDAARRARYDRAVAIAWDRDELGARTRAEKRAAEVFAKLPSGLTET